MHLISNVWLSNIFSVKLLIGGSGGSQNNIIISKGIFEYSQEMAKFKHSNGFRQIGENH